MDTAKLLIRMFARAFYETRHILAIEALITHSALHVEDLAYVLNMNPKEVRKMCQPLKEDKLISSHIRQEMRDGQARPSNRELYFINFHLAINAIKYKIMKILQKAKADYDPNQERKEYVCPRCKYEGTEADVISHTIRVGSEEFLCPNCDYPIDRPENTAEDAGGSAQMSRINDNLKPFVEVLKVIDGDDVPENNFDEAIERQKPIERSELAPAAGWTAVIKDKGNGAAGGGVKGEQQKIQVELTSAEQNEEREQKKKLAHAQQQAANALPVWYTQSTVTGKSVLAGNDAARLADALAAEQDAKKDHKSTEEENEHVRAYYEELRAAEEEEARNAAAEDGEEEDDDDDDGGDFEDVTVTVTNGGTPASTPSIVGVKRERDSDDDDEDEFEDVDVKRIKKEEDDDEED